MWYELVASKVLLVSACAWVVAQAVKVVVGLIRERRLDFRYFVSSGGMPSAHSAMVSALSASLAMTQGVGSVAFAIATVVALIVMYDAASVRQSVGEQSVLLNRIVRELRMGHLRGEVERDLRELMGHTPFQVIVGSILGILVAWLWLTFSS